MTRRNFSVLFMGLQYVQACGSAALQHVNGNASVLKRTLRETFDSNAINFFWLHLNAK